MNEGKWVTIRGHRVFIKNTNDYMNNKIRNSKKPYLGESYTPENVNDYFEKIETYEQLEEFEKDYFQKLKVMPYIVPAKYIGKNNVREWVYFIENIDDKNISFSVLREDRAWSRKTKSSIKNFVKNYKVYQI